MGALINNISFVHNKDNITFSYSGKSVGNYETCSAFPDLCVEFIILNQAEYMAVNDQIDMDSNLLESLVFDERFDKANAQSLIEDYCSEYMTSKIAQNLDSLKIVINIDIFESAWQFLNIKQKEQLLLEHLDLLDADKFELCFSEMDEPYKEFSKRKYRHEVHLNNTEANLPLAKRLEEVGYITSSKYKEKTKFDSEKKKIVTFNVISCVVKSIN